MKVHNPAYDPYAAIGLPEIKLDELMGKVVAYFQETKDREWIDLRELAKLDPMLEQARVLNIVLKEMGLERAFDGTD